MIKKLYLPSVFIFCVLTISNSLAVQPKKNWNIWVQDLKREAVEQGIRTQLLDEVFHDIKEPHRRVINLDRSQPEKRLTFLEYRKTRIDPYRIHLGVKEYKKNRALVEKIGSEFGVNPCFIIAIWGIETSYGRYMGDFPVIKSLATLAYDDRRGPFFRNELLLALHILNDGHVSNSRFHGEWAGASGHPQFLPSSWKRYAYDYDKDGKKDIWTNYGDVFASIANYLKQNHWQTGKPWAIEVNLPQNFDDSLLGTDNMHPVSYWVSLGIKPRYGNISPDPNLQAAVITPDGGPSFMIFQNYKSLLSYNNSLFYAGSVGYLADQICAKANKNNAAFGS